VFVTPAGIELNVGAPSPFSVTLISDLATKVPAVAFINVNATFMGIVFSSDSSRFYASGSENSG